MGHTGDFDDVGTPGSSVATGKFYAFGAELMRALYDQDRSVGASRQPAPFPNPEQNAEIAALLRRFDIVASACSPRLFVSRFLSIALTHQLLIGEEALALWSIKEHDVGLRGGKPIT